MKLGLSTDTGRATDVYLIANELGFIIPSLESRFGSVDLELFFVFRCLPDEFGRKSSRRFSKAEGVLYLDMCFSEDVLKHMTVDEQRSIVSSRFFEYLEQSLRKYKFKGLDVPLFIAVVREDATSIGWMG